MTPKELIDLCKSPVEGLDGKPFIPDHIYLTVPKKSLPRNQVRLAGGAGPLGRVMCVNEADVGYVVVAVFKRKAVIKFLERTS